MSRAKLSTLIPYFDPAVKNLSSQKPAGLYCLKLGYGKLNSEKSAHIKNRKLNTRKLNTCQHVYLILVNTSFEFIFRNLTNC